MTVHEKVEVYSQRDLTSASPSAAAKAARIRCQKMSDFESDGRKPEVAAGLILRRQKDTESF